MSSIDLSEQIDATIVVIYSILAQVAGELDIDFLVVGATARELMLDSAYNIPPLRRTMDIDIGVRVKDWAQFELLKTRLTETGEFVSTGMVQRVAYVTGGIEHPIDIVPFGRISEPDSIIDWQTDNDIQMSVLGFEEALENSVPIILRHEPRLEIKAASLPSQLALKLLAWRDRHADKDAKDIFTIIRYYGEPVSQERLFEEESAIMELEEHNVEYAGAHLLGKDVGEVSGAELSGKLIEIFDEEISDSGNQRLATAMMAYSIGEDFDNKLTLLEKVRTGLTTIC